MLQEKIWTRDFVLLSFVSFMMYLVFYCVMVVLAVYALQQLAATNAQAGLAAGDFLLAALMARLLAGHLIERVGKRRMMIWGLLFYGLIQWLYTVCDTVSLLISIRFLHGFAFGFCATAVPTLAAILVPRSKQSEGMGYFLLSMTLASAIGPFIGIYMYQHYDFSCLLMLSVAFAVASLLLACIIRVPADVKSTAAAVPVERGFHGYFEVCVLPISLISFVIYFCYSGLISFFSAYASQLDMIEAGQYFFLIYSLAIIVSRPHVGKLADRRGTGIVMYPSFLLFAVGLYLLSSMQSAAMMFLSAALCGIGFGTFAAMGQVIALQKVEKERFGIALSTILSISELGTGIGPFLLGGIIGMLGFHYLYEGLAVVVIFCGAMYYICCKKQYI